MVEPIFDYQFRLILIGDSTVGKSSLLKYFTDGKFSEVKNIPPLSDNKKNSLSERIILSSYYWLELVGFV